MFRALVAAGLVLLSLSSRAESPYSFEATPGQLPKAIVPEHYEVHLIPDLDSATFRGRETVTIRVLEVQRQIVLNALDIEVQSATLQGGALGDSPLPLQATVDAARQILRFDLEQALAPGEYRLRLDYSGRIAAQPQGLYYDRYPTANGQDKRLLATQMEPTDARRLLPCWDEPAFRASFQLSVDLPETFSAHSNMPLLRSEPLGDGLRRSVFDRTPKMPSYLVVLVAGELESLDGEVDGTRLSIVTTEGKRETGAYALDITRDLLRYYNDYFGVKYPLPKLDQFAVPGGLSGAMENWGGITYIESILLFDPEESSPNTQQDIFDTVAHEVAHQWFGDLVTMAWWDNLWLNEGFASWMATKATDRFNPEWNAWLTAGKGRDYAMALDELSTTHPIQQPVENESQATDAFDRITYLKGQSFLRMLETYLGEDDFREGLRRYMARHAYSNTTTADLWAALEAASGKPVRDLSNAWIEQPGYPLLTVESQCTGGRRRVTLTQAHYSVDGAADPKRRWPIPVAVGAVGAAAEYVLLKQARQQIVLDRCDGTLVVDPDAVGYFRVRYAPDLLAALTADLPRLTTAARLKLLSDVWALASSGEIPIAEYFAVVSALGEERAPAVWEKLLANDAALDRMAEGLPLQARLHRYMRERNRPEFDRLGWTPAPGEPADVQVLRAKLIESLAAAGDPDIIAQAQQRFEAFLEAPESLPPALRGAVLDIVGERADAKTYALLRTLFDRAVSTEDKYRYLSALARARDPALREKTLAMSLSDAVSPVLALRLPRIMGRDAAGLAQVWSFVTTHRDALLGRMAFYERNGWFGSVAAVSYDRRDADRLEAFAKAQLPPDAWTETHTAAQSIRVRAARRERIIDQLASQF